MDKSSNRFLIADSLRGTGFEPMRAGSALALMLLWSQMPAAKLKGLPAFKDASAEFLLNDPDRVVRTLCPELDSKVARLWTGHRPSDVENLRRVVLNALESGLAAHEIAEAILEYCAPGAWGPREHSEILLAALDPKKHARIRCAFTYALRAAWALSEEAAVDLDIEDHGIAPMVAVLAAASGRSLNVSITAIGSVASEAAKHPPYDHALIVPPLGMRLKFDHPHSSLFEPLTGDQLSAETLAALWGAHIGRKRNIVVVGNGLLFRTSSKDAAFKQDLIQKHGLETVISLPRGTLPGTAVAMSALVFAGEERSQTKQHSIRFIDAGDRTALDPATLGTMVAGKGKHPLCADISVQELSAAAFNLSVDRYVLDPQARRNREILSRQETVRLSDLAEIRRPQALPRDSGKEKGFEVREALLADIDNARLSLPAKLSELPQAAATKIESAILKAGDILLSIKGTIGKIALVTQGPIAESDPVPIVPGQSFVIVRLRKGGPIRDPEVLVSYLRSPLAQSLLQGMAGGTTIPNVAMGELKDMPVPIFSEEAQKNIVAKFCEWQDLQRQIDKLREKMKYTENNIFSIALGNSK